MKIKIYKSFPFIIAIVFTMQGVFGQAPQNRTSATIIADALAQLPANKPAQYKEVMTSLLTSGEEGLISLIKMMDSLGNKSNEKVEFAISGWTNFVANNKLKSDEAASAYTKALQLPLDRTIKQFVIKQLEFLANKNSIEVLSGFLNDENLVDPASRALANMDDNKADMALVSALSVAKTDKIKLVLINSIGQTANENTETALLAQLKENQNNDLTDDIYNALSIVGTLNSATILKEAAKRVNFNIDMTKATASYVDLLNKLVANNELYVQKEAEELLMVATKSNIQNLRISALELLFSIPAVDKNKLLFSSLKDENMPFLSNALNLYSKSADKKGIEQIIKTVKKTKSDDARLIMIYWLGNQKEKSAASIISKYLNASNMLLQKSAIYSLSKLDDKSVLKSLVKMLESSNPVTLDNTRDVLESYNGDISSELLAAYGQSSDDGKIISLNLMGLRKMTDQYKFVKGEMQATNPKIQLKAAQTLKYVSSPENLNDLFDQLENTGNNYPVEIQNAVNAVLSKLSTRKQLALISDRMSKSDKPYSYYTSLAITDTIAALNIITDGYAQSGKPKEAAFNALVSMQNFVALYPLLDIMRTSKNTTDISKVVDALTKLIAASDKTGIVKANYLQEIMPYATSAKQKTKILEQLGLTNSYQALVFIEKYLDQSETSESAAQAGMKIAFNNLSFAGATTNRILKKISQVLSNPDAEYQRKSIDKYLLENKDAVGYEPLFNGKDLTGWKGLVGNPISRAKMTKDELSKAQLIANNDANQSWVIEDGVLLFTGKGNNLCTENQYGDFEMFVDWKLLPGAEPDAGIYLRGTPQVQIWDTARVSVGAQVGSGGLYNNKNNASKPLKVADQKVGEWNTFHIKMIGERVTVYLNGELVTNNVILENYWDGNMPIFPKEQIELQAHGSKVAYRNIYIKEIPRPEPFRLSKQEEKEKFEVLFDGSNMHNWTGNTSDYVTEDGCIVIYPSNNFGGNLYTKEEYGDFVFRFQFQLTPGANNGLGIRTPMEGDAAYVGMELQILDNEAPVYANLAPYQYHGSVYGVIPAKRGFLKPVGEWNYEEVVAKGDNIKITLNGTVIVDGNIREATKNGGTMDHKQHPGLFNKKGHIGFLGHGSVVRFKDIRVKRL